MEGPQLLASKDRPGTAECLLTIAIPAYRHAGYIAECLSGPLQSRHPHRIEIVVIDDCSPDDTAERAADLLERGPVGFRLYRSLQNRGLSRGLNFLLANARGRFLIFCASDDRIDGPALDRLIDGILAEGGPPAFTICAARYIGDRSGPVYDEARLLQLTFDSDSFCRWLSTEIPDPLLLQSTLFDTAFLRRVDPWRDGLLLDDWPTFLRAGRLARAENLPIGFAPGITLTDYRVHGAGLHANSERQKRACLEVVDRVIDPRFRPNARAFVLAHFALGDLTRGRYRQALRGYLAAIASRPNPETLLRLPLELLRGLARRLGRRLGRVG